MELAFRGALLGACILGGWFDVTQRRIPNWLCGITAIGGLAAAMLAGGLPELGSHALHFALALLGGMVLFGFGAIGGGDAKFYGAAAAWSSLANAAQLFMLVAFCGLALLVIWILVRVAAGKPIRVSGGQASDGLPYGVAIGAGAFLARLLFS